MAFDATIEFGASTEAVSVALNRLRQGLGAFGNLIRSVLSGDFRGVALAPFEALGIALGSIFDLIKAAGNDPLVIRQWELFHRKMLSINIVLRQLFVPAINRGIEVLGDFAQAFVESIRQTFDLEKAGQRLKVMLDRLLGVAVTLGGEFVVMLNRIDNFFLRIRLSIARLTGDTKNVIELTKDIQKNLQDVVDIRKKAFDISRGISAGGRFRPQIDPTAQNLNNLIQQGSTFGGNLPQRISGDRALLEAIKKIEKNTRKDNAKTPASITGGMQTMVGSL